LLIKPVSHIIGIVASNGNGLPPHVNLDSGAFQPRQRHPLQLYKATCTCGPPWPPRFGKWTPLRQETISLTNEASREIICSDSLTEDAYNEELATAAEQPQTATAIQHRLIQQPGKRTSRARFSGQENIPWRGGRFDDGGS